MGDAFYYLQKPQNEPVQHYPPGSPDREVVKNELEKMQQQEIEIPLIIGGKEVKTGELGEVVMPHRHGHVLARYHKAGPKEVEMAIESALQAQKDWAGWAWEERLVIFRKLADMLTGSYRATINAATMLGQGKTVHQAEIEAACELADFLRFNSYFLTEIYRDQPYSPDGVWNRLDYRPLEGFVLAVTPFNFTAIAGNLPTAPAMAGNVALWKPASTAVYSAHYFMQMLIEAGLPDGVINFIPGPGSVIGDTALPHPELAGVHFTGSTGTFQHMWKKIGENIENYQYYPRIVGETGGKDFVVAHKTADPAELVTALIRGAFEYQGQKCSAASRAYIPRSLWDEIKGFLVKSVEEIKVGDITDFRNFMGAVIDKKAFDKITGYIDRARAANKAEIIAGGSYDDSVGYFIDPTVILTTDPFYESMAEEIFGPVLTVYLYPDDKFEETLYLCNETSPFGLTGSIIARDREAIKKADRILRQAAGNFYINDKPTAAIVNQQPFGGARASGTNDKAGSKINMYRWISVRAIKENFVPARDYRYPYMEEE